MVKLLSYSLIKIRKVLPERLSIINPSIKTPLIHRVVVSLTQSVNMEGKLILVLMFVASVAVSICMHYLINRFLPTG